MRKYAFNSFVEVVENTKNNIDSLKHVVDVLHTEFQAASDITDQGLEYRKKQLDQLGIQVLVQQQETLLIKIYYLMMLLYAQNV